MQGWFDFGKSVDVILHNNRTNEESHNVKQHLDKKFFHDKNHKSPNKLGTEEIFSVQ